MNNNNFDERQKQMRHSIFAIMFFALTGYICFFLIFDYLFESLISFRDLMFTGIILTTTVGIVLMIFKDCYFKRYETKKSIRFCFLVWIFVLFINIRVLIKKGITLDDNLNDSYLFLCITIMWTAILISYIIKELIDRKKDKSEEE